METVPSACLLDFGFDPLMPACAEIRMQVETIWKIEFVKTWAWRHFHIIMPVIEHELVTLLVHFHFDHRSRAYKSLLSFR